MKITQEYIEKIIMLSNNGYGNRQMAIELMVKESKLQRIKAEMRNMGIELKSNVGRPKAGSKKPLIATLAEFNRLD